MNVRIKRAGDWIATYVPIKLVRDEDYNEHKFQGCDCKVPDIIREIFEIPGDLGWHVYYEHDDLHF